MARFDFAAAAWVAVLTVACCLAVVRAETDGRCSRCGEWVKLSDEGAGLDTGWQGLCGGCQDPKRRCDEVLKDLQRSVEEARDKVGYLRVALRAPARLRDVKLGDSELAWLLNSQEELLKDLSARLDRVKAECSGTAEGSASAGRGSATGTAAGGSSGPAQAARDLRQQVNRLNQLSKQIIKAVAGQLIQASELDGVQGHMRSLVDSALAPEPTASTGSEATSGGKTAAASQDEIIRPTLVDTGAGLPADPVAKSLELWQRHTANASAYAEALEQSIEQVDAAKIMGDPKRAHKHLERAAYLAAAGQKELRAAAAERTAAIRTLYKESKSFEEEAKGKGKTVEEALASWQAGVRANGLPAEYVAELKKAGLSEEQIAKRRESLQSADPKEAAQTHARFVGLVAPLYLPEARGKEEGTPLPEADDLWDLVTIELLHSENAAGEPKPAGAH